MRSSATANSGPRPISRTGSATSGSPAEKGRTAKVRAGQTGASPARACARACGDPMQDLVVEPPGRTSDGAKRWADKRARREDLQPRPGPALEKGGKTRAKAYVYD